jgi:hypothetical protein
VPALERAYHRARKDAAVGVDGISKEQYGQGLEARLRDLHERLRTKRYRHQPIQRVHIPKEKGKTRPIGVSAFEDKLVQDAVREVLEAIYEQDFLDCSYGFRPGRSAHDAVRTLDRIVHRGEVNWISRATSCPSSTAWIAPAREDARGSGRRWSLAAAHREVLHVGVLDGVDLPRRRPAPPRVGALPLLGTSICTTHSIVGSSGG